jgi:hypothetical protein
MLTHVKLKTKEPLVEFKEIYAIYSRILLVIKSCVHTEQAEVCDKMIENFETWCLKFKINNSTRVVMKKHLEEVLKSRVQEIRET